MAGEKLAAACRAEVGLPEALRDDERLAVTALDDTVLDLMPSSSLSPAAREHTMRRVEALEP